MPKRRATDIVSASQYEGSLDNAITLQSSSNNAIWPEFRAERFTGRLCVMTRNGLEYASPMDYIGVCRDESYVVMTPSQHHAWESNSGR